MTIRFEMRATGKSQFVPLHVSLSDGRKFRKRHVTQIYINPEVWDSRTMSLRKRSLDEQEKLRINTEIFNLYGENTLYVDLGQVYDNLVNFGVDHYGASYSCNEIEVEISVDNVEYKSLGVYEAYYMGSAVLEVFDPQQARYVKITGIDPMNSYYGWYGFVDGYCNVSIKDKKYIFDIYLVRADDGYYFANQAFTLNWTGDVEHMPIP